MAVNSGIRWGPRAYTRNSSTEQSNWSLDGSHGWGGSSGSPVAFSVPVPFASNRPSPSSTSSDMVTPPVGKLAYELSGNSIAGTVEDIGHARAVALATTVSMVWLFGGGIWVAIRHLVFIFADAGTVHRQERSFRSKGGKTLKVCVKFAFQNRVASCSPGLSYERVKQCLYSGVAQLLHNIAPV
uniref:Uncharacterized protein n=1 Tax=Anopheles coluzzii TaxID=1518534 RepID=A0A8W7PQ53_ANOCL